MYKVFRQFLLLALCAAPATVIGQAGQPQTGEPQPQPRFHSSADVVTIHASVRDKRGHPLTGLITTDFEVLDNGQRRPILSLHSDAKSPVSVAILVDMSGSMRMGSKIAMARQAFDSILSQLRVGAVVRPRPTRRAGTVHANLS